jgi:hypothetical protein
MLTCHMHNMLYAHSPAPTPLSCALRSPEDPVGRHRSTSLHHIPQGGHKGAVHAMDNLGPPTPWRVRGEKGSKSYLGLGFVL